MVFLKPANDLATSLLRFFHLFTTLLLKEYFAISSLTLFFCNFNWWPLKLDFGRTKNISSPMSSLPFNILNTSIKSPLSLLVSSVVNLNFLVWLILIFKNLVSYLNSEKPFIILVALQLKGWSSGRITPAEQRHVWPERPTQAKLRWERENYANWKRNMLMKVDFLKGWYLFIMRSWKGCPRLRNEYWFGLNGGRICYILG